ncbi:hypothetical protein CDL12_10277 [Handroanthus impetiginosus]|uniref:C2H2-type domain-containing protein n=1 Tax=Handroanthus impetiginosus TaxID=429701 RepID=A0A2G9HHV4_9LAMI|nr:hypothetical protein CDL12_10277 [Handroanthus impetiginosus]
MNIDPSSSGVDTSSQMIISSDDFTQNFVQTRSYRCTFCKRGFSNAQALGGHMNIHRKDRAKLKEFSCDNLLSLEIKSSSDCEDSPPEKSSTSEMENETKKQCSDEEPDDLQIMQDNLIESLPLFAEAPSMKGGDQEEKEEGGTFDKHVEDRSKVELGYGELDLELRLGPEPHDAKSKP